MSARKDDEDSLWQEAVQDVKRAEDPRRDDGRLARPRPPGRQRAGAAGAIAGERTWQIDQEDELVSGRHPDVPIKDLRRLQRGEPPHEQELNLRHQKAESARGMLEQALPAARRRGVRCLLVITGRGSEREGSGVIRRSLPAWLSGGELARHVRAFSNALPRHGGAGAFYVLLRRKP